MTAKPDQQNHAGQSEPYPPPASRGEQQAQHREQQYGCSEIVRGLGEGQHAPIGSSLEAKPGREEEADKLSRWKGPGRCVVPSHTCAGIGGLTERAGRAADRIGRVFHHRRVGLHCQTGRQCDPHKAQQQTHRKPSATPGLRAVPEQNAKDIESTQ